MPNPRLHCPPVPPRILVLGALLALVGPGGAGRAAAEATIRPDGLLEVEGRPFFPLGLVELGSPQYPDWAERIRESGANLVWDVEVAYADTTPGCAAIVEAADQGGWTLMIGAGDTWNWDDRSTPELEVDQRMYEPDELDDLARCLGQRPELLAAWANRDEPVWTISREMIGDIDEAHVRETYDQLRAVSPSAPVAMNFAPAHLSYDLATWQADVISYRDVTDVMMFAAYPYPAGPGTCGEWNVLGYPECSMDRLPEAADRFLGEINLPGQPLWMIVQAFKGIPRKEARWEAYAAIVHGATGVLWAGWTWVHELGGGEEIWPMIREVIAEVASLHEFLVGPELPGGFAEHPYVDVRAKRGPGDAAVLFAVSREGFAGPTRIRLPKALPNRPVDVVGENRSLRVGPDGWIDDRFEAYEAHVYRYPAIVRDRLDDREVASDAPTDVPAGAGPAPGSFRLWAAPNPSAGPVHARFELPAPTAAVFSVIDAAGRRVARLGSGTYEAGGTLVWNGRDERGRPVAPGVYFVRGRTADGRTAVARVVRAR